MTTSCDWYVATVVDTYRQILGRDPDPSSFLKWVAALASGGVTANDMDRLLYASPQYVAGDTVSGWVDHLYRDILGRPADPGGSSSWTGVAASRGRGAVVDGLVSSAEARARRITEAYATILGRAPDPGGLASWSQWEATHHDASVRVMIAASPEAYGPMQPGEQVVAPPPVPLPAQLAHNGLTTKMLTVRATTFSSTTAEFAGWERSTVGWRQVFGPWTANVGSRGWSMPAARREGAGTTPAGRYGFGTGFGLAANPGYALGWFVVGPNDYWTSDPSRADYNTHQLGPVDPRLAPWSSAEHLIDYPVAYRYAALIGFNAPPTGPYGSAIFLHVSTGGPTAGCVSLPQAQLLQVLRWIDGSTRIVMGPDQVIRTF